MTDRPSFVLFMTDQQRADWLGCAGHPVLETPNIDAIAASGTRFVNGFVAHPICMPNRASLLTCRMPSVNGVRHNGLSLPLDSNTFVDCLRRAGYATGLIGKGHHQPFSDMSARMQRGEWDTDPHTEARLVPPGTVYRDENADRWAADPDHDIELPYYGFDHFDHVSRHGDGSGGGHERWLREHLGDYERLIGPENQLPHDFVRPDAIRTALPEEAYSTAWIRDRAVEFIEAHTESDQPFFLMVSFPDPHHPFTPPGKYWDMYSPDDMSLPASFVGMEGGTPLYEMFRNRRPEPGAFRGALECVDEREATEAMALTAGMMAMVDDAIGMIRGAIGASAQADETVQIYTSDHGDMMGDHGLMLKGPVNLDGILKVPFLWSDPQRPSVATSDALVSTIDIGATVLARAGARGFNGIQGIDLTDALATGSPVRDQLLVEHDGHVPIPVTGDQWPPRIRTLVTPEWKMSVYLDQDWGELFNRGDDPHEMRNLWDDPSTRDVRAELTWLLSQELIRTVDRSPLPIVLG